MQYDSDVILMMRQFMGVQPKCLMSLLRNNRIPKCMILKTNKKKIHVPKYHAPYQAIHSVDSRNRVVFLSPLETLVLYGFNMICFTFCI